MELNTKIELEVNYNIFDFLEQSKKPIKVLQGGTGSGKTYTILQRYIIHCLKDWHNETIDIVRRTFPFLRISVMKDFFDILHRMGIYNEEMHNKTDHVYQIGTNIIRFYSADDNEKIKGARRTRLYVNEALEFKKSTVDQMLMRTSKETIIDYNPSEEFSFIYDDIIPDPRTDYNQSTYLDNPFIPENSKQQVLRYKETDPNLWRIYGLGERGVSQSTIYHNFDYLEGEYEKQEGQDFCGLDFGFNDPTAMIRVKYHKNGISIDELIYKTNLTSDLVILELDKLVSEGRITKNTKIIADNARPEMIQDISKAGYNIHSSKKGKDSLLRGINFIKKHKIWMTKESTDLARESRGYKWKVDKNDKVLDEPVDLNNHLMDALRYALEDKSNEEGFSVRTG
jgi:phage terminase large subunit